MPLTWKGGANGKTLGRIQYQRWHFKTKKTANFCFVENLHISGGPTVKTQTTSDHVFLIFNILGKFSNTLKYVLIMIHKKAKGTLKENNNCSWCSWCFSWMHIVQIEAAI